MNRSVLSLFPKLAGLTLSLFILATLPFLAWAHGSGVSFEKDVGDFRVDIGYDLEQFMVGERAVFDFSLYKIPGILTSFEEVWVRILKADEVYLATGIKRSELGKTTLLFRFGSDGLYTLETSFRKGGEELAKASFPVEILRINEGANSERRIGIYGILLVFGLVAGVFLGRCFIKNSA